LIIGYLSIHLTLTAVIRWGSKWGQQAWHKAGMNSLLMVMRACASTVSCNENNILLTCLLLYHITFLRRVETRMEIEEHSIAGACWAIGCVHNYWWNRCPLYYLNVTLRSCTKTGAWRCSVSLWTLGSRRVIICFKCILVVLVLLLPRRMVGVRWRSNYTSLLNLILICSRRESIGCLLLGLHLSISGFTSAVRISCCCSSVHINLVLYASSKVLLSLVHHMMMLNLISCHWRSNLDCLSLIHRRVRRIWTTTLDIHRSPTANWLVIIYSLDPGITIKFTSRWSDFRI